MNIQTLNEEAKLKEQILDYAYKVYEQSELQDSLCRIRHIHSQFADEYPSLTFGRFRQIIMEMIERGILRKCAAYAEGDIVVGLTADGKDEVKRLYDRRLNNVLKFAYDFAIKHGSEEGFEAKDIAKALDVQIGEARSLIEQNKLLGNLEIGRVVETYGSTLKSYRISQKGASLIVDRVDAQKRPGAKIMSMNKVFIVHGHDESAKEKAARFVEQLGFEAIILHEKTSQGKTIIEKIEKYSDVGFALVLYTDCDVGAQKDKPQGLQPRARQNVVFEHGYLIGKIGRSNVCALVKGSVETPGDISGVVYEAMDEGGAWRYKVAKEMRESGYDVDMNKIS